MKYVFKHKGYYCEVYFSEEDECHVGRVLGIISMIAVHENTASETIKELSDSQATQSIKELALVY